MYNLPVLFAVSDYKLTDLLGAAGATIGIILTATLFLQFLSAKFGELSGRYRELTKEYRSCPQSPRHSMLQAQIKTFRSRMILLNRASWIAGGALLCFLGSVLAGGVNMANPEIPFIRLVGTYGLFLGLVLIGIAVAMELLECIRTRYEITEEVEDLDDGVKGKV